MKFAKIVKHCRIDKPQQFRLAGHDPAERFDLPTGIDDVKAILADGVSRLTELQRRLYADGRWAVLIVLQAMDAAGKDGVIKHVMSGINPQGCEVHAFKAPSTEELQHLLSGQPRGLLYMRDELAGWFGNHDRYGTTFANTERVVKRVTALFSHMIRLNGSQIIPLSNLVALIGVDGWADGLGGEGRETRARINDFYQILDFATDPEPQVFRAMKERAGKYSRALRPSLIRALKQYQTTIIATHVPPYEGAAWHEGWPSSPAYQPFFSSPTMGKMIKAAVAEYPGKSVLVLCGHTHSSGIYCDGKVLVLTAGARYGFPEISKTIHLERLHSIFASSHIPEPRFSALFPAQATISPKRDLMES